ncbi:hypothetical protein AOXY_G12915, partial [Acipenser oxyrinchus oxyrinchus]
SQQQNGLLLMALKMKHKLTKEAVSDMLDIINLLAGKDTVPQSWYHLEKQFEGLKDFVEIHHVCNFCESYLGKETSEKCTYCEKEWIEQRNLKEGNFFFHLPLHAQIKAFLEDPELSQKVVRNRHGFQSQTFYDITSGKKYQDLSLQSTEETLSVMFSCDGLPVFKSSSFCVWPVLCVINELPATERFNHIFLASLWSGCKKPDMSVYLQPFVFECRDLATEGLLWVNPTTGENTITKVITTVAVCDTVARPMLQNMTQFNGKHGCGFCLDSGDVVPKNRGTVRAYPYKTSSILRNAQATLLNAEGAVQSGKSVNGVKGPSLLGLIPHFDIISNFVPDYMHCILLGVCRQMATLWFDSQYHQYQFYIGLQINKIDSRLLDIKPPSTISRVPHSVTLRKYWKAHEWYAWLMFYSIPVLKGILQGRFFYHWCQLAEGVATLLREEVTSEDVEHCEKIFTHFVVLMEDLYGIEHVTYNVHLTLHLAKSVCDWGPLWAHSAFAFESYNSSLLDFVKGTQGVPQQMCKKFLLEKTLPLYGRRAIVSGAPIEPLFKSLISNKKNVSECERSSNITIAYVGQLSIVGQENMLALHSVTDAVLTKMLARYYLPVIVNGEIIHSKDNTKVEKHNSYTVQLLDGELFVIKTFVALDFNEGPKCFAVGWFLKRRMYHFCSDHPIKLSLLHVIAVDKETSHLSAVKCEEIRRKFVFVDSCCNKTHFVCVSPNRFEVTK